MVFMMASTKWVFTNYVNNFFTHITDKKAHAGNVIQLKYYTPTVWYTMYHLLHTYIQIWLKNFFHFRLIKKFNAYRKTCCKTKWIIFLFSDDSLHFRNGTKKIWSLINLLNKKKSFLLNWIILLLKCYCSRDESNGTSKGINHNFKYKVRYIEADSLRPFSTT